MDIMIFKSSVLLAFLNLELILAYPKKWQFLRQQSNSDEESLQNIAKAVDWIIFVVDKPFLRTTEIINEPPKSEVKNYLLEPYNTLQLMADDIQQRSGKKRKKKVKKEQTLSKEKSEEKAPSEETDSSEEDGPSIKDFGGLKLTKRQREMLREKWRNSCDKKASKVCKKACTLTYKTVCKSYRCRSAQKRQFKKECSRNCKSKFLGS